LIKIDEFITNEFQTINKKCEDENIDANGSIRKLGNVFLNAQQMSAQLTIYIILSHYNKRCLCTPSDFTRC
jgi:hypothetical protein